MPCHPPEDLPKQEIEPMSPRSPALAVRFFTTTATWEALIVINIPKMKFTRSESNIEKDSSIYFFSTITPFLPKKNHSATDFFVLILT